MVTSNGFINIHETLSQRNRYKYRRVDMWICPTNNDHY